MSKAYIKPVMEIVKFESSEKVNSSFGTSAVFTKERPYGVGTNTYSNFYNF